MKLVTRNYYPETRSYWPSLMDEFLNYPFFSNSGSECTADWSHYNKALGILSTPLAVKFWNGIADGFHATGDFFRKIYTGNGQTYLVHIILFVVVVYAFVIGG